MPRPAVRQYPLPAETQRSERRPHMTRTESTSVSSDDNTNGAVASNGEDRPNGGSRDYGAKDIQVLEGLDPVRKRPGCTSARPGSPVCTTSSGRSSTTPSTRRWPASPTASSSPCSPTAGAGSRTTGAASPSIPTRRVATRARAPPRSCSPCSMPAASSAARATRSRAASTASASASSTPCPNDCCSRSTAAASATARSTPRVASHRASSRSSVRHQVPHGVRIRSDVGNDDHVLAGSHGVRRRGHRVRRPHRARAAADDGVPQPRPGDPARRRASREGAEGHLPVPRRHRRLRQAPQRLQGGAVLQGLQLRGRRRRRPDARHRRAVEHRLLRGHPRLRQRHLHHRGRDARRGLQDGADVGGQQVRPGQGTAQGEGRQPPRRGHPRGDHGDHLGEAARPAVRGSDQGQARQRPDALVRPEGHVRTARRLARGEPHRGQPRRQEGDLAPPRHVSPPRTPAMRSAARRRCRAPGCPTS